MRAVSWNMGVHVSSRSFAETITHLNLSDQAPLIVDFAFKPSTEHTKPAPAPERAGAFA